MIMMHDFLSNNRRELESRCIAKADLRPAREATALQLSAGVPLFLDQLIRTLEAEQTETAASDSLRISGPSGGGTPVFSEMGTGAAEHGRQLFALRFSIDQLVHGYGDLCQSITDLAVERAAPFNVSEFRTLNRCLDNVIADAVTEYGYQRDQETAGEHASAVRHQLGSFANEMRDLTKTANLAFAALKAAHLGVAGATGTLLERSLSGLDSLIDAALAESSTPASGSPASDAFQLASMIKDVSQAADVEAQATGCRCLVSEVDPRLAVHADRKLISASVAALLRNAFRVSAPRSEIVLNAYASGDRILIDVKDGCGGLKPGDAEKMFPAGVSPGQASSGFGLGLSIARRDVESSAGSLTVRDVPGEGCVLTINRPRYLKEATDS
jgi:signal transduction histidine kinase